MASDSVTSAQLSSTESDPMPTGMKMDICNLELSAPVDIQYLLPLPPTASWHFSVDGEILHALLDVEYHDSNAETIEFLQRNSLVRLDISFLLGRTGAIDANIRNVIAVFSLNYWCGIFGKAYVAWAFEELKKRDRLQVKLFLARRLVGFPDLRLRLNLDVNRLEAEIAFINQKIRRRRTAMHIELLSYLFQRFDTLIWPALDVRGISSSQNRPFGSDRVRQLLFVIGHSELLARAKRMARQYQGKRVVSGSEFQGTIRCSWCGHKNDSFAGELFQCASCHYTAVRDIHAAANAYQFNILEALPLLAATGVRTGPSTSASSANSTSTSTSTATGPITHTDPM